MSRYVAFLRGVSPINAKMTALKSCFEQPGFANVKTVLTSRNAAFDARANAESTIAKQIESDMAQHLPRSFPVIVRSVQHLLAMIEADPYAAFDIPANAKRVVTFLAPPHVRETSLPIEMDGVRILGKRGNDVFTAYVPNERGPIFMTRIEKRFGKNVTTRTWDTIRKCASA